MTVDPAQILSSAEATNPLFVHVNLLINMVHLEAKWMAVVLVSATLARNFLFFAPKRWHRRQNLEAATVVFLERQEESMITKVATIDQHADGDTQQHTDDEVTIVLTTNLIPTSPDIMVVNETVHSLYQYLHGLPPTTPLIITVDGLDNKTRSREDNADERWHQYVANLRKEFHHPYQTVLPQPERINLIGNLQEALKLIQTEFVYIIQHDMPFLKQVRHAALIRTMKRHPDEIKMVRFNYIRRHADKFNRCKASEQHFKDDTTEIELTKHHVWSDK